MKSNLGRDVGATTPGGINLKGSGMRELTSYDPMTTIAKTVQKANCEAYLEREGLPRMSRNLEYHNVEWKR